MQGVRRPHHSVSMQAVQVRACVCLRLCVRACLRVREHAWQLFATTMVNSRRSKVLRAGPRGGQVSAGVFETAGGRGADQMEDRHVMQVPLYGLPASALLAIFDGHRGPQAAQYAADYFLPTLRRHWRALR